MVLIQYENIKKYIYIIYILPKDIIVNLFSTVVIRSQIKKHWYITKKSVK